MIKLGRGHEADIRISDISVSRLHAVIRLEPNGLFLEDKDSKFGSLVLCRKGVQLDRNHPHFNVQIGKSLFQLSTGDKSLFNGPFSVGLPELSQPATVAQNSAHGRASGLAERRTEVPGSRVSRYASVNRNPPPPQPIQNNQSPPRMIEIHPEPVSNPPIVTQEVNIEVIAPPQHEPVISIGETGVFHNLNRNAAPFQVPVEVKLISGSSINNSIVGY